MQTIIIKEGTTDGLQLKVNNFLKNNIRNVKQINYCAVPTNQFFFLSDMTSGGLLRIEYSCMIILED